MDIYIKNKAGTFNRKQVGHIKSMDDVKDALHGKTHFFATEYTARTVAHRLSNTLYSYLSPINAEGKVIYVFTNDPIY